MSELLELESSMINPIEESQEEISDVITFTPNSAGSEIERLLMQVVNLSKDNIFHEPTCNICSSPDRDAIEQAWLQNRNTSEAQTIYKEKTGKKASAEIIENHMTQHLTKGVREIQQIEYVNRIKRLHNQSLSTLDRISMCVSVLMERLMGVNSITANGEESIAEIEKIKSAETSRLMGVLNNFLKLQAGILGEMKQSGELITIPSTQFVSVFNSALLDAKTDKEKQLIKGILDKLANISKKSQ